MFKVILMNGHTLNFNGLCNKVRDSISGCLTFEHWEGEHYVVLAMIPVANISRVINAKGIALALQMKKDAGEA